MNEAPRHLLWKQELWPCAVEDVLVPKEDGAWIFRAEGAQYQACTLDGDTLFSSGCPIITWGQYGAMRATFVGPATQAWSDKDRRFIVVFPDGLRVENGRGTPIANAASLCFLVVCVDLRVGDRLHRESARPFVITLTDEEAARWAHRSPPSATSSASPDPGAPPLPCEARTRRYTDP